MQSAASAALFLLADAEMACQSGLDTPVSAGENINGPKGVQLWL